jgi:hypothetical protein
MSELDAPDAAPVSSALTEQWHDLLSLVCSSKLDDKQLAGVADVLLYDGEDVPENKLTGDLDEFSPCRTPVERLDLFVRTALGRLKSESTGDFVYDPKHFDQLRNLRQILWLTMRDPARAFSELERVQLLGQWTSIQCSMDRIDRDERIRMEAWKRDAERLGKFQEALARLPKASIAVESLRSWVGYRSAARCLYSRPNDPQKAADQLGQILTCDNVAVPPGLYFRIALLVVRNPNEEFRKVIAASRLHLAVTFALLPSGRAFDRIGVAYLLALDALWQRALRSTEAFLQAVQRVETASEKLRPLPLSIRRELTELREDLKRQVREVGDSEIVEKSALTGLAKYHELLPLPVRNKFATEPEVRKRLFGESNPRSFEDRLYFDVLRAWFDTRTVGGEVQDFSAEAKQIFSSPLRDQAALCRLLAIGQLTRVLGARGHTEIDRTLEEYRDLIAIQVLSCDWEHAVKTLGSWGYTNFLENLGLRKTADQRKQTAEHIRELFGIASQKPQNRQDTKEVDQELLGLPNAKSGESDLRYELDHIDGVWRWDNTKHWIKRQQGKLPKPMVCWLGDDHHLASDMQIVAAAENHLGRFENDGERAGALRGLASCALQFANVLQRTKFEKLPSYSRWKWIEKGTQWADELIRLCEEGQRWTTLYAGLEVRIRLGDACREPDHKLRSKLRERMLELDARNLDSTKSVGRRHRSALKAERTMVEVMNRAWCSTFERPAEIGDFKWLPLFQDLKTFNFGELVSGERGRDTRQKPAATIEDDDTLPPEVPDDEAEEDEETSDTGAGSNDWQRLVADHLKDRNAAVLEFFTHPGGGGADWRSEVGDARKQGVQGTVCFVIKPASDGLVVRPLFLNVPQSLVRAVVDGDGTPFKGAPFEGLGSDLFRWGEHNPPTYPECVSALGANLFSEEVMRELDGISRIYLCAHRHLFQIPMHALPLSDGSYPFLRWEVGYALKLQHLADLLASKSRPLPDNRSDYALVDVDEFPPFGSRLLSSIGRGNHWAQDGLGIEQIVEQASAARRAIVFCHGQMDKFRPQKARLRLWGGGRLTADDIQRMSGTIRRGGGEWMVAACQAGKARVGMQTTPGLALSLVMSGAPRVTSCFYSVSPESAHAFVARHMRASDEGVSSPFTSACRSLYQELPNGAGWPVAASFASYGLFGD